jgi:cellulose synthase/poly-beta-1,6-N-acetylglucosamine synthase-like glycosyltransferase
MTWSVLVLNAYLGLLALLSANGMHRLWLLWAYRRRKPIPVAADPDEWPIVTVQLPIYNERYVVERLIGACGDLAYPRDRLQIQVLDDSTDDTTARAAAAVAALRASGVDAVLLHRDDRAGFKAGALEAGLQSARGDVIAIFDADFVPPKNFLKETVPYLRGRVGMVQARWGHLNWRDSWLTTAQSTLLDGHFVIEHTARHATGRWFNFNGTAGIWRRQAIIDAGGWEHDTLTEDLDLSYRAQLQGWQFLYRVDLIADAELPPDIAAFKTQQSRWAKGSIQTARKLLLRIWRASVPLPIKVEATVHLTANLAYPLILLLSLLLPWAIAARIAGAPPGLLLLDLVLFGAALDPFVAFYAVAILGSGRAGSARRLVRLPYALALGLGMAVNQTWAVIEGATTGGGAFVRTPKQGGGSGGSYRVRVHGLVGLELALAAYLGAACIVVIASGYLASLPFLALFAVGYGSVGLQSLMAARTSTPRPVQAAPAAK